MRKYPLGAPPGAHATQGRHRRVVRNPPPSSGGPSRAAQTSQLTGPRRCRAKFLKYFPEGFADQSYLAWERDYKAAAHRRWRQELGRAAFGEGRDSHEVARLAVAVESRTNLLFSFEKMALRDAVRATHGARAFVDALAALLHGRGAFPARFDRWCAALAGLPRRQTRVLTWPVATVFPFLAQPDRHFFLKPRVTQRAFAAYGLQFDYASKPNARTYEHLCALAQQVREDLEDLGPRDLIDVQSFLWVMGSDEYP